MTPERRAFSVPNLRSSDVCLAARRMLIVEEIETPKQLSFLRKFYCTANQGFHLNAPMAAVKFAVFLRIGVLECLKLKAGTLEMLEIQNDGAPPGKASH